MNCIRLLALVSILISVLNSCQEEPFVAPVDPDILKSKLKVMSNYLYEQNEKPNEKIFFFYDSKGRLSGYDLYQSVEDGFEQTWKRIIKYSADQLSYEQITWSIENGKPTNVLQKRKVKLNQNQTISTDKMFDSEGNLIRECTYSYFSWGYTVMIRQWTEEYKQFTVTKVACETQERNVIRKRVFQSYFEKSPPKQELVVGDYSFTHSSTPNPLFEFHNLFGDINSIFRYADAESRNITSELTIKGGTEDYVIDFVYKFEEDHVKEATPGGYSIHKRTFEYY